MVGQFGRTAVWQNCWQIYPLGLVSFAELLCGRSTPLSWSVWQNCCGRTASRSATANPRLVSLAEFPADLSPRDWSVWQHCCAAELVAGLPPGLISLAELPAVPQGLVSLAELLCGRAASRSTPPPQLVSLTELLCGRTTGRSTPQDWSVWAELLCSRTASSSLKDWSVDLVLVVVGIRYEH